MCRKLGARAGTGIFSLRVFRHSVASRFRSRGWQQRALASPWLPHVSPPHSVGQSMVHSVNGSLTCLLNQSIANASPGKESVFQLFAGTITATTTAGQVDDKNRVRGTQRLSQDDVWPPATLPPSSRHPSRPTTTTIEHASRSHFLPTRLPGEQDRRLDTSDASKNLPSFLSVCLYACLFDTFLSFVLCYTCVCGYACVWFSTNQLPRVHPSVCLCLSFQFCCLYKYCADCTAHFSNFMHRQSIWDTPTTTCFYSTNRRNPL